MTHSFAGDKMSTLFPFSPAPTEKPLTWLGKTVKRFDGTIEALQQHIPTFTFSDFNDSNYQVNRQPLAHGDKVVPVGTVSKRYTLIQHQDLIAAVSSGLSDVGLKPDTLAAELRLSEYGERMHLRLMLPNERFDPGDGNLLGIALNCLNSVDRSTALELQISWYRLVCDNGMYLTGTDKMRRVHIGSLDPEDIRDYLESELREMATDKRQLTNWFETPVNMSQVDAWADTTVADSWGPFLAARTCHISRSGFDGKVANSAKKIRPSLREVSSQHKVPGSCAPVTNVYHVSQVLSWLARERNTIQDQFEKMLEIPALVTPLLN
jgi:Domain of unknown function (DUF932)